MTTTTSPNATARTEGAATIHPQGPADVEALRSEAAFLLDRLSDFGSGIESYTDAREWEGHVQPSIARLRRLLAGPAPAQAGEVLKGHLLGLVRLAALDNVGHIELEMEDVTVDGRPVGSWKLTLTEAGNVEATQDPIDWTPNSDYANEAAWPPQGHPLGSLFHNARLNYPENTDSRAQYERVAAYVQGLAGRAMPPRRPEQPRVEGARPAPPAATPSEALTALQTIANLSPEPNDKAWHDEWNDRADYRYFTSDGRIGLTVVDSSNQGDVENFGHERGLHAAAVIARGALDVAEARAGQVERLDRATPPVTTDRGA